MFDVTVIGGGPAGVTAALRASELGARTALIERGHLGGTCTNDGCVPTRVLAKAARLMRDTLQFAEYGLEGERPTVNLAAMLTQAQQVVYRIHEKKQLHDHLTHAGVTLFTNTGGAQFEDPHTLILTDGQRLQSDKFIICAGGRAREMEFPGSEYALTHHDVWDLKALPSSIAVVGGAATGCQLASIFNALGAHVTLLERAPRLLPTEDVLVAAALTDAFEERGLDVITGITTLQRIDRADDGYRLIYEHNGRELTLPVQAVFIAVGWIGNADQLNLEAAGVERRGSYIEVNDLMQTSVPHIFAAGDITGKMMLVQSGSLEGRVAAENAVLGPGQDSPHCIVPHGSFTDPEYASVGLTEEEAIKDNDCIVEVVPYADLDRAVIDGHTDGMCKLIVSRETHRILGAHIVGEQALEAIHLVAGSMAADMWIEDLAELELAYPTYTAIVGTAARRIAHTLGVTPVAPQWRVLARRPLAEWERNADDA